MMPSAPLVSMPQRTRLVIMGATMLGLFFSAMSGTVVSTAMPRIIASLGGIHLYSWPFTAFMLTSTVVIPIAGKLSDVYGRKPFFLLGIAVFLAGSVLCGFAGSMMQLIVFRGVSGIGSGIIMATAFTLIADLFTPRERGRWQGLTTGVFALSSIVGPLLGGSITDHLHWRWVFFVNVPLGLAALAVLAAFLPWLRPEGVRRRVDYAGAAALVPAVVPLLLALAWAGNEYAWLSPQVTGLLGVAVLMTGAFLWLERRAEDPVLPLSLFRHRIYAVAVALSFLVGGAMFAAILYIPLFVQGVIGSSATGSGLVTSPMMVSMMIGSTLSGQTVARAGRYRPQILAGLVLLTAGLFLLSTMGPDAGHRHAVAYMLVVGGGIGLSMPLITLAVQNSMPFQHLGVATSSLQFFRSIGSTIGAAVLGSLLTLRLDAELERRMPAEVASAVPADLLDRVADPQLLLNAEGLAQARGAFAQLGQEGGALFEQALEVTRVSLAGALGTVYLVSAAVMVLSVAVGLLLEERPLRGEPHRPDGEPAAPAAGPALGQAEAPEPRPADP